MFSPDQQRYRLNAVREFERLRQKATLNRFWSSLMRTESTLMPFDKIEAYLPRQRVYLGLREVDLDHIVGSLNRHHAFDRKFYPLSDDLQERWVNIRILANTTGWPPVSLHQVGNLLFVEDGHHRISVARQLSAHRIEAKVWDYQVPLQFPHQPSLKAVINQLKTGVVVTSASRLPTLDWVVC